jgi:hypothetical protein
MRATCSLRNAALLFVDFLHRNNRLVDTVGRPVINDVGLAALTLLVAGSAPQDKDIPIRLIMHMIGTAPALAERACKSPRLVTWGFEWWLAEQGETGHWEVELTA